MMSLQSGHADNSPYREHGAVCGAPGGRGGDRDRSSPVTVLGDGPDAGDAASRGRAPRSSERRSCPRRPPAPRQGPEARSLRAEPVQLCKDDRHLPYATGDDREELVDAYGHADATWLGAQISAARCARVSYPTHDGVRDWKKDIELSDKLVISTPPHWSPLEHVCCPAKRGQRQRGNLRGWQQLRHVAEDLQAARAHDALGAAVAY